GRQVLCSQIQRFIGGYLYILESLVVEPGHELILFLAAQDKDIGLEGIGLVRRAVMHVDVRHVGTSCRIEPLHMFQPDGGTLGAFDSYPGYSRHVLSEVVEPGRGIDLLQTYWLIFPYISDWMQCLGYDVVGGGSGGVDIVPLSRIKFRGVPSRLFFSGIVVFTRIDAVEDYRTWRGSPLFVGCYNLLRSIRIGDVQIEAKFWTR